MITYTLEKPTTTGASAYEIIQGKINGLEVAKNNATERANARAARLEVIHAKLESRETPRRDRLRLEGDLAAETSAYYQECDKVQALYNEIKGFRKALDVMIVLSNSGGSLNDSNRNHITNILSY